MFVGVHVALAMRTGTPELMMTEEEAKGFMKSAQNVLRHYSVQTTQKTLDWIAFVGAAGSIYGTRAFAIAARRAGERQAKEASGQVLQWPVKPKPRPEEVAAPPPNAPPSYVPSVHPGDDGEFNGFN